MSRQSQRRPASLPRNMIGNQGLHGCSHLDLGPNGDQVSTEPQGRSCLSGFSLFMRHVAPWEMEQRGEIKINKEEWAVTTYSDQLGNLSYDDTPQYKWNENFNVKGFASQIDRFNLRPVTKWLESNAEGEFGNVTFLQDKDGRGYWNHPPPELEHVHRVSYASDAAGVLCDAKDIAMPVLLPAHFAAFVNSAMADAGLPVNPILPPVNTAPAARAPANAQDATLRLFIWRIPTTLLWQQLDRRIDEVMEALYAFYRVHDSLRSTMG